MFYLHTSILNKIQFYDLKPVIFSEKEWVYFTKAEVLCYINQLENFYKKMESGGIKLATVMTYIC